LCGIIRHNGDMSASETIRQGGPFAFSALLLLLGLTACVLDPSADFRSRHPDQVLFHRAMSAMQHNRLDVARLSLQTLVNTYPNSAYASNAERALEDLRLEECNGAGDMRFFDDSLTCEGGATALPVKGLELFPAPDSEQPSPHP
jgi:hypothetical protein